jgi:hypothetical protein
VFAGAHSQCNSEHLEERILHGVREFHHIDKCHIERETYSLFKRDSVSSGSVLRSADALEYPLTQPYAFRDSLHTQLDDTARQELD